MDEKINYNINQYLQIVCETLKIDWEDYLAQLEFEIPLCWALPPFVGFMYSDIFLYFLDLDFFLYRKIAKDIDKISQGIWVPFELSNLEKIWMEK